MLFWKPVKLALFDFLANTPSASTFFIRFFPVAKNLSCTTVFVACQRGEAAETLLAMAKRARCNLRFWVAWAALTLAIATFIAFSGSWVLCFPHRLSDSTMSGVRSVQALRAAAAPQLSTPALEPVAAHELPAGSNDRGATKYATSRATSLSSTACEDWEHVATTKSHAAKRKLCFDESKAAQLRPGCRKLDFGASVRLQPGAGRPQPILRTIHVGYADLTFVIQPYWYTTHPLDIMAAEAMDGVSLTSQASLDRLEGALDQWAAWEGPVSVALFAKDVTGLRGELERVMPRVGAQSRVALHLVVPLGQVPAANDVFPVNLLRATAQQLALTPMVFVLDADLKLAHSSSVFAAAVQRAQRAAESPDWQDGAKPLSKALAVPCSNLNAFVVPAFELARADSAEDISDQAAVSRALLAGTARPMHAYFPCAYLPTRYAKWFASHEPYPVAYVPAYEPYVIISRDALAPNVSFVDRGKNKGQWAAALSAAGYGFTVLPDVFVMDVPNTYTTQRPMFPFKEDYARALQARASSVYGVKLQRSLYCPKDAKALLVEDSEKTPGWAEHIGDNWEQAGVIIGGEDQAPAQAPLQPLTVVLRVCGRSGLLAAVRHFCTLPGVRSINAIATCWSGTQPPSNVQECDGVDTLITVASDAADQSSGSAASEAYNWASVPEVTCVQLRSRAGVCPLHPSALKFSARQNAS